jgi:hypothetical protein
VKRVRRAARMCQLDMSLLLPYRNPERRFVGITIRPTSLLLDAIRTLACARESNRR